MLEVRNLTKHYGALRAVEDLSFEVRAGEVLGLLGPNGSGTLAPGLAPISFW